jgi:hypothetical protein
MLTLARLGLQMVLFLILVAVVIGVATPETGTLEKVALAALGGAVIWLASRVRRLGARSAARPA